MTGHYFGRIRADARAAQAQEQTVSATARTEQVSAQAYQVAEETGRLNSRLASIGDGAMHDPGGEDMTEEVKRLRMSLKELDCLTRIRFDR